jgi:hypothetical protein
MQDAVIAGILCFLGFGAVVIAAIFAFKQKAYVDTHSGDKITEIDVPLFGKLKTNTPSIALCFVAVIFGYFAYDLMKKRGPDLISFNGEVNVDQGNAPGIDLVMVGITSGSWIQTSTPNGTSQSLPVKISVPNSWPSYTAFALAVGSAKSRPDIIGASLDNPTFKLRIKP